MNKKILFLILCLLPVRLAFAGAASGGGGGGGGGSGTVTSVSLTMPSSFTVTGSPVTTSGTFAVTFSGTAIPVLDGGTGTTTSTGTGSVVLSASPTFTGVPLAPTASVGTNTTQLATTAFVLANAGTPIPATSALTESAGAVTITATTGAVSSTFTLTLNANLSTVTLTMTDGQTVKVYITNTTSNYTVTWGNSIQWPGGVQPVQTVGAHSDFWVLTKLGTTIIGGVQQMTP